MGLLGIVGWLLLAVATGWVAQSKGRGFVGWLLLGALLPIIGLIAALAVPRIEANIDARAIGSGGRKRCPYCAELVRASARVCRFCERDLPTSAVDADTLASMQADQIQQGRH